VPDDDHPESEPDPFAALKEALRPRGPSRGELAERVMTLEGILRRGLAGARHRGGCAALRYPAQACDCWMADARAALEDA
jgi:hypothetical protein